MAKGRTQFTHVEADGIRHLLYLKVNADRRRQIGIRGKIRRKFGFYITDFDGTYSGFTPQDFDDLIRSGRITIVG